MDLLGAERVEDMDIRMTAEDFAWFTQSIPGMMYRLGVKEAGFGAGISTAYTRIQGG